MILPMDSKTEFNYLKTMGSWIRLLDYSFFINPTWLEFQKRFHHCSLCNANSNYPNCGSHSWSSTAQNYTDQMTHHLISTTKIDGCQFLCNHPFNDHISGGWGCPSNIISSNASFRKGGQRLVQHEFMNTIRKKKNEFMTSEKWGPYKVGNPSRIL